jgi:hypothetical protein
MCGRGGQEADSPAGSQWAVRLHGPGHAAWTPTTTVSSRSVCPCVAPVAITSNPTRSRAGAGAQEPTRLALLMHALRGHIARLGDTLRPHRTGTCVHAGGCTAFIGSPIVPAATAPPTAPPAGPGNPAPAPPLFPSCSRHIHARCRTTAQATR